MVIDAMSNQDVETVQEIRKLKASMQILRATLRRLFTRLNGNVLAPQLTATEPPLRAELFSADQMALRGKRLAAQHKLTQARQQDQLLPRMAANEAVLIGAEQFCAQRRFSRRELRCQNIAVQSRE